ncbi:MAG: hypothetical protein EXS17_00705 [Phycisphaerales bacterium]|nr:hypothetical protein [Phycisphaerales bacterium]
MQLFIVRHAKAAERDVTTLSHDSLRPLTNGGAEKFARLAKRVGRLFAPPELVLASGYVRAWETARILEESAGWPAPLRCAALECDAQNQVAAVSAALIERSATSLAIVGHEPFLSEFIGQLIGAGSASIEMDKGAVALLEVDSSLRGGSLRALIYPAWVSGKGSRR